MPSPIEKLQKFFKLEAERGYDNRAVVGGLDKILPSWNKEAQALQLDAALIDVVVRHLNGYQDLDPAGRAVSLNTLLEILDQAPKPAADLTQPSDQKPDNPSRPPQNQINHQKPVVRDQNNQNIQRMPQANAANHTPRSARPNFNDKQPASLGLKAPLTVLPNIGPHNAQAFQNQGVNTLGDLLFYFPRRYDDYSHLKPIRDLKFGEVVTVIGMISSIDSRQIHNGKRQVTEAVITDSTGFLRITWFNQPWLSRQIHKDMQIVVSGKIEMYLGRLVMNSPDWEPADQERLHTNRIVPVYPLNAQLKQGNVRRLLFNTVSYWAPRMTDPLPLPLRQSAELVDFTTALQQIHFPDTVESLAAARDRLAFDEILYLQLGVLRQKLSWQSAAAQVIQLEDQWFEERISALPFQLTNAQHNALTDIRRDLASGKPMNRLIQGDVGSGKTIVAALTIAALASTGAQSALMAPTSILAEQHHKSLLNALVSKETDQGLQTSQIRLLTSSTPENEKESIRQAAANGEILLLVGTTALIEETVQFKDLQLVIVDEQHRFGVEQRATLRGKGTNPHLLVMTATPIPRSLALTVYGDLDLTVMDELPAGRQPIETHIMRPLERERVYKVIRKQIKEGHQAFIIYPLVEQGERDDSIAAVEESERLQREVFPDLRVALLHGRMKAEEKDAIMIAFRAGEFDVLVSTSVIEVGVDVPNATVMVIEGANRFGLAQLHQFRGRVGRGSASSYCFLIPDHEDAVENERLLVMAETNDGFVLAEKDLEQRGPGDFLGTRQSGYADLRLASLMNVRLIEKARHYAEQIFASDPSLSLPEHAEINKAVAHFWSTIKGDIS